MRAGPLNWNLVALFRATFQGDFKQKVFSGPALGVVELG